jgi:anti-sigma B factor antagonist
MPDPEGRSGGLLEVRVDYDDSGSTIALIGEFDLAGIDVVRDSFIEVGSNGADSIVIDLRELTFIDSSGIAFLLAEAKADEERRLSFIASPAPSVQRVLTLTGVSEVFGGAEA